MTNLHHEFIDGLIHQLKSDDAQKRIKQATDLRAQLSRVFDKYVPSTAKSVAMYKKMIRKLGQDALRLPFDDEPGQAALSIKVMKEMDLLTENIANKLLTPNKRSLKQNVKRAMGASYSALLAAIGEEDIMKLLIQAALVSYVQAITAGCSSELGIVAGEFGASGATDEQLDKLQAFSQNILMKMNLFAYSVDLGYIKLISLDHQLTDAIEHLNGYRENLVLWNASTKQTEITTAVTALSHFQKKLSMELGNIRASGDYSMVKKLATERATELAGIIKENILDKPNLAQLHGFFEHLLNIIIITFTLGHKSYTPPAKQAAEELNDYLPINPGKP